MINDLTPGDLLSAAALVFSIGVGVAVLQRRLRDLALGVRDLLVGLNKQTTQNAEMLRQIAELNIKHTPEHADHSGFGTVEMGSDLKELLHRMEIHRVEWMADRDRQSAEHEKIAGMLKTIMKTLEKGNVAG